MTGTMIIDGRELVPIGTGHARNAYVCIAREVTYRLVPIQASTGYQLRRERDDWRRDFPTLAEAVAHIAILEHSEDGLPET
jgi:hypothetical protein